jgi:type I restriction enzyme, S subunit
MVRYPVGWRVIRLADAGKWLSGGTPLTSNTRYWGGEIPWISAASLKDFRIIESDRNVTRLGATAGTRLVPRGTILFVVRGMSLKTEFRIGIAQREVAFGQDCKALVAAPGVDAQFLAYSLMAHSGRVLAMVDEAGHGTGRLPTDQLARLEIGVPSLYEQRRIAEILVSMDELIASSEKILAKLDQVARDAARELVGVNRAERRPLAEVCSLVQDGTHLPPARVRDGPLLLSVRNMVDGKVIASKADTRISWHFYKSMHRNWSIEFGDVLLAVVGATLGKVARVGVLPPFTVQRSVTVLRSKAGVLDNEFMFHALRQWEFQRQIWTAANQTAQPGIYLAELRKLHIPIPSFADQFRICSQLEGFSRTIEIESDRLSKLRKLKQGLMEDLLTGQVRSRLAGV